MTQLTIRATSKSDYESWSKLMHHYYDFYKFAHDEAHLKKIFEKITTDNTIHSFLAFIEDTAVGVANYLFHPSTFSITDCYLSDVYVNPEMRGQKIATRLIDEVKNRAKKQGCNDIYWLTASTNTQAQALYDKIATKTTWILYTATT